MGASTRRRRRPLDREEAPQLIRSVDVGDVVGLHDRAVITTLIYTAARAGAVAGLKLANFCKAGSRRFLHFEDRGGKSREIPCGTFSKDLSRNTSLPANSPTTTRGARSSGRSALEGRCCRTLGRGENQLHTS